MKNVKELGQVFTPPGVVQAMLGLRQRFGSALEPSAGDGAFLRELGKKAIGVEISPHFAKQSNALCMDFFDLPESRKFDTIIGNPPYVRHQDIPPSTRAKLDFARFDRRSNLYLFFIEKCLHHLREGGEMIFITPRDFLKATAAKTLNKTLFDNGTITHYEELGDARIFDNATPNCAIWRYEKDNFSHRTDDGATFMHVRGQLVFAREQGGIPLSELFTVKVGAVSGMDSVFASEQHGNCDFICSQTAATGKTRRMIFNTPHPALKQYKPQLLARKIRSFDESNWWQWGRNHHKSPLPRIYVNAKTRHTAPFFVHSTRDYDGSVLALFPQFDNADLPHLCEELNTVNWGELGFICGGRFLFSQRSLQNCPLPEKFARHLRAPKQPDIFSYPFAAAITGGGR